MSYVIELAESYDRNRFYRLKDTHQEVPRIAFSCLSMPSILVKYHKLSFGKEHIDLPELPDEANAVLLGEKNEDVYAAHYCFVDEFKLEDMELIEGLELRTLASS